MLEPRYDPARRRWRVTTIGYDAGGERTTRRDDYPTKSEADRAVAAGREALRRPEETTVQEALNTFLSGKAESVKPTSLRTIRNALTGLLLPDLARPVGRLDGQRLYDALRQRPVKSRGGEERPRSVAAHHFALFLAREWGAWLVKRRLAKVNPFSEVQPIGRPKRAEQSKVHLTKDEARAFLDLALAYADEGREGAILACLYLLCGFRGSEPLTARVRDLDDGGAVLWVQGKGDRRRQQRIPLALREPIATLARGKLPLAPLFTIKSRATGWSWVKRLCREAGVAETCPHGLRAAGETALVEMGHAVDDLAEHYGHGPGMARRHYIAEGAEKAATQERRLKVLQGGRRS